MRSTLQSQILAILSDGNWHSSCELANVSHRFGDVLFKLKKKGYDYETKNQGTLFFYKLKDD